jgi:hypothetical protein
MPRDDSEYFETLDTAAARVIHAMARVCRDLKLDEKGIDRPEFGILTLVRAAGWLIGFTAGDPSDQARIDKMIDVCCDAVRTAASDPMRGAEGAQLTRQMMAFRGGNRN